MVVRRSLLALVLGGDYGGVNLGGAEVEVGSKGLALPGGVGTRGWVGVGRGCFWWWYVCATTLWLSAGCALDILSLVAFVFGQSLVGCTQSSPWNRQ
jgi:hypothetical protein